jgi:hypothetical protein
MVTKGYQKGVYERVTKGINGLKPMISRDRPIKIPIKIRILNLRGMIRSRELQMCWAIEGAGFHFPMRDCRTSRSEEREHDLDSNHTDGRGG